MDELLPVPGVSATAMADLDEAVRRAERTVTLADLGRSGRSSFRVVRRRDRLVEVLSVIEAFVETKRMEIEREFGSLLVRREQGARAEARVRVLESFVDLADLADDLVSALGGGPSAAGAKALDRRIDAVFRTHGFERIRTVGERFDSEVHEIVDQVSEPALDDAVVVREVRRGYRGDGVVLRPARVVVNFRKG